MMGTLPLDPTQLGLPANLQFAEMGRTATTPKGKLPRHKLGEPFLKGPIPWQWLCNAAQLPGKALHVAINLWFLAGMKRTSTFRISVAKLKILGVKRHAGYRGLKALENAGLVAIYRHPGRKPIVTLLDKDLNAASPQWEE